MEFLAEYGLFLAKAVTFVAAVLMVLGAAAALAARHKESAKEHVEVRHLNEHYEGMAHTLEAAALPRKVVKQRAKARKKALKQDRKQQVDDGKRRIYVLNFHGDLRGTEVAPLREEITAVLTTARPSDEVVVRLESTGGLVHAYGLGASQLHRIKERNIPLTVTVDKVAASGGYLMACVADKVIAAPFSVIGSIGVLAQIPNFHRLLKKHDVDFEQFTAGEYKRTVTLFGKTTDKAREKLAEEIQETHTLFKDFVARQRPGLDMDQVATGEHWLATRALELGLVDELSTSDDYLLTASDGADIYEVTYSSKQSVMEKLSSLLTVRLGRDAAVPGDRSEHTYLV